MTNIKKIFIIVGLILVSILWLGLYYTYYGWQLFGYDLVDHQKNDIHIIKGNERKVPSTIVDYEWHAGYLIGLRLNVEFLECESHDRFRHAIQITDERRYFILNVYNEEFRDFSSSENFMDVLASLNLIEKTNLNVSSFDGVESYYSNMSTEGDYSNCKILTRP
ncbi:hypothetical protein [Catenovulum sediminis]|uniref:DUF4105 domain-containing protein n=1 Tax=Catenovulum sediminis TaxID=1740262 RepID=A0ABV1RBJ9_9ALTE